MLRMNMGFHEETTLRPFGYQEVLPVALLEILQDLYCGASGTTWAPMLAFLRTEIHTPNPTGCREMYSNTPKSRTG